MPDKNVYLTPDNSADSIAALKESYAKDMCTLHNKVLHMQHIFETHKKYCRITNIIWAAICVLIYLWF